MDGREDKEDWGRGGGRKGLGTDQGNINTCGKKGKKGSSGGREGEV